MRLTVYSHQEQGLRDEQEDRVLWLPEAGLFCVLDGLGGHEDGARAAQTAADVLRAGAGVTPGLDALRALFAAAHEQVAALAPCPVSSPGSHRLSCGCRRLPATTLTALWIAGERAFIGHVGDTRIWRVRRVTNGTAEQLTKDHHDGWFLLRSIGGKTEDEPDLSEIEVRPGDTFVLVSDGVHLTGEEIAEVLACEPMETAAQRLVARGMERYGAKLRPETDNASALVVRIEAAS